MVVNMHYCMNLHFFFVDVAFINFNVIIAIYHSSPLCPCNFVATESTWIWNQTVKSKFK